MLLYHDPQFYRKHQIKNPHDINLEMFAYEASIWIHYASVPTTHYETDHGMYTIFIVTPTATISTHALSIGSKMDESSTHGVEPKYKEAISNGCTIPGASFGDVPSLDVTFLEPSDDAPQLVVKSFAPYKRFAVRVADDGMNSFGLREGHYAIFRESRWPDRECSVCLIRLGDDVTIRLFEGTQSTIVALRVSGDRIPPMELEPTGFSVVGVLDGVLFGEFAELVKPEIAEFDWGC